jgi:HSP20 family molecular chaperone IbpA
MQQGVHPAEWQKDRSALEMGHGSVAGSTGMMGSMPAGSHGMIPQKDMSGGHQTHAHHQLTPQEIDDEVVGRMRQRGYAPLDLIQCPTHYLALFDLPGVFKDQITLCIDRGLLKMTVHRPENAANPHQKHRNNRQQQESGLNQQPNPQFQGQQQQGGGGFGKVTVEDDVDDDFDVGVVKGIERAYERDRQLHQRSQVQSSQIRDSGSMSSSGGVSGGQSAEMRKSPNVLPPGGQYLCKERPTGRIDRFIRLPHDIQETVSDAKLENGVLSVTIGRSAHHQRAGGMMGGSSR